MPVRAAMGWLGCGLLILATLTPVRADEPRRDATPVNLQHRLGDLPLTREGEDLRVAWQGESLSPEQFLARLEQQQQRRDAAGPLYRLLNITTPFGVVWVAVGLLGQLLFTGRMLAQWWTSERARRSVVPPVFWWLSLGGATMLLVYFVWRKDIVGILGQGAGWAIYARNLWLIHQRPDPTPPPPVPTP
jgi:lipid-A-disaccharide synthase-like uncharacterized protein